MAAGDESMRWLGDGRFKRTVDLLASDWIARQATWMSEVSADGADGDRSL